VHKSDVEIRVIVFFKLSTLDSSFGNNARMFL